MDLLKSVGYPEEIIALFKFKFGKCDSIAPKNGQADLSNTMKTCYRFLNETSRSFAAVIQALDGELRHAVCVFYLVLRALDTVEDDMSIPTMDKIPMLQNFHTYLLDPHWRYTHSQEKDKVVLEQFPVISQEFRNLSAVYQHVISDICQRMGQGMVKYLDVAPSSMDDWDEYCHYVAGLVGMGLSRLFSASKLEPDMVGKDTRLANSMGLFLQKTNIIRDYLEDVMDAREFWPKEAWGKYSSELKELAQPQRKAQALACLNELITHALHHVPDVLLYLSRIENQSVFNFCAIPQVMAIATLERCYNNPHVFRGVVKIRKGEAVRLMMEATSMAKVRAIFKHFCEKIQGRIPNSDPSQRRTRQIIRESLKMTVGTDQYRSTSLFLPVYVSCALLTSAIIWQYWTGVTAMIYDSDVA